MQSSGNAASNHITPLSMRHAAKRLRYGMQQDLYENK